MQEKGLRFPRVGVGVMVFRDGKVLLGKRKNAHGEGEFASPGGHLEFGESFEGCARREVREETGVEIENIRFLFTSNIRNYEGKHYVHIQLICDWKKGEAEVLEPEKCEEWGWYELDNLPTPLFSSNFQVLESLKSGRVFYDS